MASDVYHLVSVPDKLKPALTSYDSVENLAADLKEALDNPGYYFVIKGEQIQLANVGKHVFLLTNPPIPINPIPSTEELSKASTDYLNLDDTEAEVEEDDSLAEEHGKRVIVQQYEDEDFTADVDTDSILSEWSDDGDGDLPVEE